MENLHELRWDNEHDKQKLLPDDRRQVDRIIEYLKTYNLPAWDLQTVYKDLIGMAAEAEARGESFAAQIGEEEPFCKSLLQSLGRKNRLAQIMYILFCVFSCLFVLSVLKHLGLFTGDRGYISVSDMVYLFLWLAYFFTIGNVFMRKVIVRRTKGFLLLGNFILSAVFLQVSKLWKLESFHLFANTPVLTVLFGVLLLLFFYIYRRYQAL